MMDEVTKMWVKSEPTAEYYNISFNDLCSEGEYRAMNFEERNHYLDKIYNGDKRHLIYGEIGGIRENVIFITPKFILVNDFIVDFKFLSDYNSPSLGAIGSRYKIDSCISYCHEHNLKKGMSVICQIMVEILQDENRNYLTFDIFSIDPEITDFFDVVNKKYHIDLSPKPNEFYKYTNEYGKVLITDKLYKKCTDILEQYEQEKKHIAEEDMAKYGQQIENLKDQTKLLEEQYEKISNRYVNFINFLRNIGIDIDGILNKDKIDTNVEYEYRDFDVFEDAVTYLQCHLQTVHSLNYSIDTLKCFWLGLSTNQLLLLVGRPGTGKTSLVRSLAESFGFEKTAIVPVQSNWTSKEDLLGYYNPIENTYVATEFTDSLQQACRSAEKNPDKLYFICLDEMNLSHIEYYFADFLSKLQDENPNITLYSEQIAQDIAREIECSGYALSDMSVNEKITAMNIEEKKYFLSLVRMTNMLMKYNPKLTIPPNVKFIGTLNQDATTMDLSPKVLDRSYVIRLDIAEDLPEIENSDEYKTPLRYRPLASYKKITDEPFQQTAIMNKLQNVKRVVYISQRVLKQLIKNRNAEKWAQVLGEDLFHSYALAATILPKVRISGENYQKSKERLNRLCQGYPFCQQILEAIDNHNDNEIDFWSAQI